MHNFKQIKILPYSPEALCNLVLDIELYPEFLPWCEGASIITQNEHLTIAEVAIGYSGFSDKYRSQIIPKKFDEDYIVEVEAISGPFKFLRNLWKFIKDEKGCRVEFSIEFAFKSFILDKLMSVFINKAAEKMIQAFEERAKMLNLPNP